MDGKVYANHPIVFQGQGIKTTVVLFSSHNQDSSGLGGRRWEPRGFRARRWGPRGFRARR